MIFLFICCLSRSILYIHYFDEIPSQYIAVFIGAVFTFFIPSITRATKEYFQKRTANKYLKNILKEQNSGNPDISIKNIMNTLRILKLKVLRQV